MTDEQVAALSRTELTDMYMNAVQEISAALYEDGAHLRRKPLVGGCFGHQGFALVSHWLVRKGLDDVTYYVADAASMFIFARGESKAEALEHARLLLNSELTAARLQSEINKFKARAQAIDQAKAQARDERISAFRAESERDKKDKVTSIPRRRRRIFDESDGKCHYCATPLTLDGKWHIEHKMPKALGGDNQPGNLVASCVTCNHRKRDTTDVEFKARLAKEQAA